MTQGGNEPRDSLKDGSFSDENQQVLSCPKQIDLLTFWFLLFGLVLVKAPKG